VFKTKSLLDLQFKSLRSASNLAGFSANADGLHIDLTINEGNFTLTNIGGTLTVAKGGTGATTASGARTALELGSTDTVTFGNINSGSMTVNATGAGAPVIGRTHASTVASNPFFGVQTSGGVWLGGFLGSGKYNNPAQLSGAAMFDSEGTLQKVSGSDTDCVLVNGTSASCGSTGGGDAAISSIQSGAYIFGASTDLTANTYTVSIPGITEYTAGMVLYFSVATANTGSSTLNVNNLGAITMRRASGGTLTSGDLATQTIYQVRYDGSSF
jgi:hypothetical protein